MQLFCRPYSCFLLLSLTFFHYIQIAHAELSHNLLLTPAQESSSNPSKKITRRAHDDRRHFHRFITRPDIDAPVFNVENHDPDAITPGYWFVAFYRGLDQNEPGADWLGPHIYDGKGELIWGGGTAFKHWNVFDFGQQDGGDTGYLTLLAPHLQSAYILDKHYELLKTVPMAIGTETKANMHSFHVIDGGKKALILDIRPWMMPPEVAMEAVGYNGTCDARYQGFRELDLETEDSRPLFEWDAKDWIGLEESTYRKYDGSVEAMCKRGWDILHLNSIAKFPDGDYLLSSRHTDTLYKISRKDGSIVWRLGGVKNDFEFVGDSKFSRQHHGRVISQNDSTTVISLFDNAVGDGPFDEPTHEYSRGLLLSLNTQQMKAEMVAEYRHPNKGKTNARGSAQILPNAHAFICWAYSTRLTEHTPDGRIIMEASLSAPIHSYRAFKYPWIGLPRAPPDVVSEAVQDADGVLTIVHVSWNGATEVRTWGFMMVGEDGETERLGWKMREGFETRFLHRGFAGEVFVEAFGGEEGELLGRSGRVWTRPPTGLGVESKPGQVEGLEEFSSSAEATLNSKEDLNFLGLVFISFLGACAAIASVLFGIYVGCIRKPQATWSWQSNEPRYDPLPGE